jgi:hypothetical protein
LSKRVEDRAIHERDLGQIDDNRCAGIECLLDLVDEIRSGRQVMVTMWWSLDSLLEHDAELAGWAAARSPPPTLASLARRQ